MRSPVIIHDTMATGPLYWVIRDQLIQNDLDTHPPTQDKATCHLPGNTFHSNRKGLSDIALTSRIISADLLHAFNCIKRFKSCDK